MSRRTLKRIGVSSAASSDGTQSLYSKTRVAAAATAKGAGRSHLQSKLYWCRNRWKQAREPYEADAAMRGASCAGLRAWATLRSKCINRRQLWVCDDRAGLSDDSSSRWALQSWCSCTKDTSAASSLNSVICWCVYSVHPVRGWVWLGLRTILGQSPSVKKCKSSLSGSDLPGVRYTDHYPKAHGVSK